MKRAVVTILIVLLLLACFTYAVGYGHDQLCRPSNLYLSDRQAQIVELYSKRRDGPDTSSLKSAWTNLGEQRLNKCRAEIALLWARISERVNAL